MRNEIFGCKFKESDLKRLLFIISTIYFLATQNMIAQTDIDRYQEEKRMKVEQLKGRKQAENEAAKASMDAKKKEMEAQNSQRKAESDEVKKREASRKQKEKELSL